MSSAFAVLKAINDNAPALPASFTRDDVARMTGSKRPDAVASFRYQGERYTRNDTRTSWAREQEVPATAPALVQDDQPISMIEGQVRFSHAARERMRAVIDDFMGQRVIPVFHLAECLYDALGILDQADAPRGH